MGAQRTEAIADVRDRLAEVHRLRAQVEQVQGRSLDAPALPAYPALSRLLPGGGLRPGSVYTLAPGAASVSLLLALLAPPSQAGSWCGVVGMPHLGAEAAERLGVDLSRLVVIPDPGSRWLAGGGDSRRGSSCRGSAPAGAGVGCRLRSVRGTPA